MKYNAFLPYHLKNQQIPTVLELSQAATTRAAQIYNITEVSFMKNKSLEETNSQRPILELHSEAIKHDVTTY